MEEWRLPIEGMNCGGCVASVRRALEDLPQVQVVSVEVGQAILRLSSQQRTAVIQAIEDAGFGVPQAP